VTLFDEDGLEIPRRRRTIALCRCGKSGISPLCDGTHKLTGLKFAGSAIRERRRGGDVEAGRAGDEPGASEEP
jgi:CDGSH-type Zn-finger protein